MKCPYINPVKECFKCPFPECVRSITQDSEIYRIRWKAKNPDRVKIYNKKKWDNYYSSHKEHETARIAEWKKKNPKKAKKISRRAGKKYRAAHKQEEKVRAHENYLKRIGRQKVS